ncbi:MAG: Asp-tRNA(Asn)/Glu-tRNA(Gln) amidotransferase subunit GatC [Candidatus Omnitrophota bacterium]
MAKLDRSIVKHVARLARIKLEDAKVDYFLKQMESILEYIDKLNGVNIDNAEPTTHPLPLKNVYREDRVKQSLSAEEALENAPQREGNLFKVPPVIEV